MLKKSLKFQGDPSVWNIRLKPGPFLIIPK
jgi:hypothetical protein